MNLPVNAHIGKLCIDGIVSKFIFQMNRFRFGRLTNYLKTFMILHVTLFDQIS